MAGKMEMSLDDIIKENKTSRPRGGPRRGGGRSPRRGTFRGSPSGRRPGGGVFRGRSTGGISRSNSFGGRPSRPSNLKRDAFLGSTSPRKFGSGSDSTKLIVSNLDFGVTDSDILELFSEFGQLKSAGVHYDRSGRSLGLADLIFERRADAIKAMKQYNGVPLDGREMNIQLASSETSSGAPFRSSGPRLGGGFKGGRGSFRSSRGGPSNRFRGNKPGGPGGKPGGRPPKKAPTAAELDAELEEYVKSKVSNSEGA